MRTIYIISGACGIGKSTITKKLFEQIKDSVRIEGDFFLHLFEGKEEVMSWEDRIKFSWDNILSTTRTIINYNFDVIIDFVVEEELSWFCENVKDLNVHIKYVVLTADKEQLLKNIQKRGTLDITERSLFLHEKFNNSELHKSFLLDITGKDLQNIAEFIIKESRFIVK